MRDFSRADVYQTNEWKEFHNWVLNAAGDIFCLSPKALFKIRRAKYLFVMLAKMMFFLITKTIFETKYHYDFAHNKHQISLS